MSTGNIPHAFSTATGSSCVQGGATAGRRTITRNVAVSPARESEDARRMMGNDA